ncbi:hypothetical protein IEQ34_019782 [Dendrobium chrysotoxum]|uniref:Uncharacterized protein n=1 Tax=Dendrobium chrysotoxum TaxID=161865 RepID=A0AAV7G9F7_DENCH|nr:hypothetical protein IEQ34_019782 [Dendrobium chrysotoxum]
MQPHDRRRPDFASSEHFSFSFPVHDHLGYGIWAENLKTLDNSFGKQNPHRNFGPWARAIRLPESSSTAEGSCDASSPTLWKSASPDSRPNISRAQMIDKYRQEMMDLVRDLPETAYELSLRDMVDLTSNQRREEEKEDEAALTERWQMNKGRRKRRVNSNSRIGSMLSGGFLLKMFMPHIPAVLGDSRKISPRPMAVGSDGEWVSGGFQERSTSNSSNGSSNSSCSSRGRQRLKLGGCYSFCYRHRRSRSR